MSSIAIAVPAEGTIQALDLNEIDLVSGGTVVIGRAFYWAGVAYTIKAMAETAYDVGYWVGSH